MVKKVSPTLDEIRTQIGEWLKGSHGSDLWDLMCALRGPDTPSERGDMTSDDHSRAYKARRARKYKTVEAIREVVFFGSSGGSCRHHPDTKVLLPPNKERDHFDHHVEKAARLLGLTVELDTRPNQSTKVRTPIMIKQYIPAAFQAKVEELNKAREAAVETERVRAELAANQKRIDEALAKIAELTPPPPPPKPATPRPSREQFTTPEAFDAAIEAWGDSTAKAAADKALADAQARSKAEADARAVAEQEAKQQADLKVLQDGFRTKREIALTKYPDYAEVAEADTTRVDVPTALAIMQADNGPDMLYHLGKNPTEAARIAALTPQQQVFEVGRLSATLAQPTRPVVSKAPVPLRPIQATREQATDANREESMDEVAARVRKRENAGRVGMWGRPEQTH